MREKKRRTALALVGATLSAPAASLCCIVPFAAALLGLAGFGVSSLMAAWRPYLLAITFSLLGAGFYLAYRPQPEQACASGAECKTSRARPWNKWAVWMTAVLVITFSVFPYYGGHLLQAVIRKPAPAVATERNANTRLVLKIQGMDCQACALGLQQRLSRMAGVNQADVNFRTAQAVVQYNPHTVGRNEIVHAITDEGFKLGDPSRNKK